MAPSQVKESDRVLDRESLHALLALALGRPVGEVASTDWNSLLAAATRERLLGLTWSRGSDVIRAAAPVEVAKRWQRGALLLGLHARAQLDELAQVVSALSSAGVPAVVLKGAPLAQRIYNDFTLRPTLDSDLFVPVEHRSSTVEVLHEIGWRRTGGQWPEEETFERQVGDETFVLEVHSSPIDDASLDHIALPVEASSVRIAGHAVAAQGGPFLPAYLASHLVKHHEKPLLWAVDFAQLWNALDEVEREEALRAASQVGLQRHLKWAVRLAKDIFLASSSSAAVAEPALRRLQHGLARRSDLGRLRQLVWLSASPSHAYRVLAGRLWPAAWRHGWRAAPAYFSARAVRWAYRHAVFERSAAASLDCGGEPTLSLDDPDCANQLSVALARSHRVWVSSVGQNMAPAIPPYALAGIASHVGRVLAVGDVVMVRSAAGQCTLERVTSLGDDFVRVKSDTHLTTERSVSREAILGLCDLVRVGDDEIPIERRPFGNAGMLRAIVRARFGKPAVAFRHVT